MNNLHGLILCGGKSSRMGTDKSLLEYFDIPHRHYLYQLLQGFCSQVFLSLNIQQAQNAGESCPVITDAPEFNDIGPMSALLSAWKKFPESSLLVIGCDYPFINKNIIRQLIQSHKGNATCFVLPGKSIYEPLLTIYESSFYPVILENFRQKNFSLSKILEVENANAIQPMSLKILNNVNTKEEYLLVKELIQKDL
jgi:molybdenum cofactor guanylyltransferase